MLSESLCYKHACSNILPAFSNHGLWIKSSGAYGRIYETGNVIGFYSKAAIVPVVLIATNVFRGIILKIVPIVRNVTLLMLNAIVIVVYLLEQALTSQLELCYRHCINISDCNHRRNLSAMRFSSKPECSIWTIEYLG